MPSEPPHLTPYLFTACLYVEDVISMDLFKPSIQDSSTVSFKTSPELYFTFVTADIMGRKYVPPNDPARRTSSGVRFGWKSFSNFFRSSSSPWANVSSPVCLFLFGNEHIFFSTSIFGGGIAGGSLYISFFCELRRALYAVVDEGNPGFDAAEAAATFFLFCCSAISAVTAAFQVDIRRSAITVASSQVAFVSSVAVRRCRLNDLTDLVSNLPTLDVSNMVRVIFVPFPPSVVSLSRDLSTSRQRSAVGSGLSNASLDRDTARDVTVPASFVFAAAM
mmetsp:Transcript_1258/g.2076  ORF Transcript_1258/g.2076 Transcript_1258/m.2076 type:complete len:277 (+) Transcript_1258:307-1137(+)